MRTDSLTRTTAGWTLALAAALVVGCGGNDQSNDAATQQAQRGSAPGADPTRPEATGSASAPRAEDTDVLGRLAVPGAGGGNAIEVVRSGKAEAKVGQPYEYVLSVRNVSDQAVSDVVLREEVPAGFSIASRQPPDAQQGTQPGTKQAPAASQPAQAGPQEVRIGTLQPGEERRVVVAGTPGQEGAVQACTSVSFQPLLCSSIQVVKPDLQLDRWITVDGERAEGVVYACDRIQMHYRVTNTGSGTAEQVRIVDQLPQGVQVAGGDAKAGQQQVEIPVGALESGASQERRIQLQAQSAASFDQPARAMSDSDQAEAAKAGIQIVKPDLALQVDGPSQQYFGRSVAYRIGVSNPGQHPVRDVEVRVALPEGAERVSVSSQRVEGEDGTYRIGQLAAGEKIDFTIQFEPTAVGSTQTTAVAKGYCVPEKRQQIETRIVGVPAIRLEMIDVKDPVQVGENTVYEIRVKNQGSADDRNIRLRAQVPEQLEVSKAGGQTEITINGRKLEFAPVERLAPGEIASWRVEAKAGSPGDVRFQIEMTSDAQARSVTEQEPTTLF